MLAGSLEINSEEKYYTTDFNEFYKDEEMAQELTEEELNRLAVCLNSPWSQSHEKWIIECNCVDAYTLVDENEPTFRCSYKVVGCDGITSSVIGYGGTQQEALQECIAHFEYLQNEYNKEGESF